LIVLKDAEKIPLLLKAQVLCEQAFSREPFRTLDRT
jgi:hypothetical protein